MPKISGKVSKAIKAAVADKTVTKEEWQRRIKPLLEGSKVATPEMRAVLDLWADDRFVIDGPSRGDMRTTLERAGYDIPFLPSGAFPEPGVVGQIVASNVTEVDEDFAALLERSGRSGNKTTVAVLDAGFALDHPALQKAKWTNPDEIPGNDVDDDHDGLVDDVHGWDFAGGDEDPSGNDHGSHVAGIATRGTDRIEAIACRVLDPLDPKKIAAAIDYACDHGARAINLSFVVDSKAAVTAIKAAMERHPTVLFVKSAGNDGQKLEEGKRYGGNFGAKKLFSEKTYLAMSPLPNMIVVAATNARGERAEYSNFGLPYTTVAMRGSGVYSAAAGSGYQARDGTSMATPNVTAVVAKCLTLAPALTPADVRQILLDTADKNDGWKDGCVSGGPVSPSRAMRLAALVGMVRHDGEGPKAAAAKLGLKGKERTELLRLLEGYPAAPA